MSLFLFLLLLLNNNNNIDCNNDDSKLLSALKPNKKVASVKDETAGTQVVMNTTVNNNRIKKLPQAIIIGSKKSGK